MGHGRFLSNFLRLAINNGTCAECVPFRLAASLPRAIFTGNICLSGTKVLEKFGIPTWRVRNTRLECGAVLEFFNQTDSLIFFFFFFSY